MRSGAELRETRMIDKSEEYDACRKPVVQQITRICVVGE